jgi:hypothetical protein
MRCRIVCGLFVVMTGWWTLGIQFGRRRRGKLQPFFACAVAPEPFLREVPLTFTVNSSASPEADADVSGANSSPYKPLHSPRRAALSRMTLNVIAASKVGLELARTEGISNAGSAIWIEQPSLNIDWLCLLLCLSIVFFLLSCVLSRLRPACVYSMESCRHSAYVFPLLSMCQM